MEQGQSIPPAREKLWGLPCYWGPGDAAGTNFLLRQQLLFSGQAILFLAFLAMFACLLPSLSEICLSMARKNVNWRIAMSTKVTSRDRPIFDQGD